jgi:hypothetical protein
MSNEDFTDLAKIKDRIAKLLRMADDASSPNEAAIAASRARKLMDKYQLSRLDIKDSFEEDFAEQHTGRFFASMPQYLSLFLTAVAKYNDCQPKFQVGKVDFKKSTDDFKKWGHRAAFVGFSSDVQLAVQMYETLLEAVNRLCKEYMTLHGYKGYNVRIGGQFKMAAVLTIQERLREMTLERDKIVNESTGTSLVVLKSKAVEARFGEVKYKTINVDVPDDAKARAAYVAGVRAGRSIEIVRNIEG